MNMHENKRATKMKQEGNEYSWQLESHKDEAYSEYL